MTVRRCALCPLYTHRGSCPDKRCPPAPFNALPATETVFNIMPEEGLELEHRNSRGFHSTGDNYAAARGQMGPDQIWAVKIDV